MSLKIVIEDLEPRPKDMYGSEIPVGTLFLAKNLLSNEDDVLYLRTYDSIVELGNPGNTWSVMGYSTVRVTDFRPVAGVLTITKLL